MKTTTPRPVLLAFVAAVFLFLSPLRGQQDSVTDCPLITAHPWYVDFRTDYDCWCTVGNYGWSRIYNNSNFGIQGSSSGHSMIASPAVALPADSTGLRFYWTDRQYSSTNTYYVLVSRGERMNLDDYDTLFTSMPGNGSLVQRSVSLADYAGDTVYIAFRQNYQNYRGLAHIFHVAMYNSVVPIGNLEAMADAVAIGDTVRYAVHLTHAADSLLTFSWHSTLLDTTFITTDSTLVLVYPVTGSDTLTVTVSNAYGTLVLQSEPVDVYDCSSVGVIPWEEDFSYDGHVACWVENGFNRRTNSLSFGYEDGSRGSFVNLMYTQTAGGYLLTRPITVPVDADNLALMVEFSGGLDVRVSPTASTDTASYTDHLLSEPYVANRMKSRWVNLASYAGQTIRVGLFCSYYQLYINQLVLDYVAHPLVILTAQEKTTTDSATLFVASLRHGSTEGLHYAWHSAAGGTIATNAAGDSARITYSTAVPGGVDTVRVIATNDYGTDTTYKAIRIVDCTPATTLPWVETFADGIVCWYKPEGSNFISDIPYSESYYDPYFERFRYLKSTCNSDTADHWIVSKAIVIPSDTNLEMVLEWKVGSSNTSFVHTYQVLATSSDDFTDTSLYIPLYFDSSAHGSYTCYDNRAVSLRQFAGQTIHIAFRNRPVNYAGTNTNLLFDDITVRFTNVPVVSLSADNSTYYYGDTATFTATLVEGNPDGLAYTWRSTLLDTTIVGDNTLSLCYGLQNGYDTITVIATNAYGSDTAFVVVTSQIIMQPSVVYFSADGMAFFLEKDHAEVGDTLHYVFVRNRCVTTGLTYSLHSSLLDTTITMAAVGDTCRITLVYTAAGNDSLTAEVANVYGAGTAMRYLAVRDCPAVGVPFCETFDSIETLYNDLLPCWPGWWVLTTSHMVGSSVQSHLHYYLISPAIDLPADTCGLQLSWYTAATTGTTIPVRILVSPTGGKRVEDFTDTLFSRQIVNHTDNSVSLDAYLGQRIRVAFTNYGYMFDNIRVDYDRSVPLVPQPTIEGSATAHLFDDNVYVASLVSGCPQGTTYSWCSSMANGGLATLTVNGDTAEVRYLALGSDTLRCIATNSFGSDTAVAVVRVIDCSARAVPYYMDFESVTATEWNVLGEIPDCWLSSYDGSNAGYAPHVIDSCPYYGLRDIPDNALIMSGEFPYGSESEVILPCFTDSLQNLLLALDYRYERADIGILTVGYRGADGIFNVVDTLPGHSGSYRRHIVSFADVTIPNAQIVLRWQVGGQWAVVIDNIEVSTTPMRPIVLLDGPDETEAYRPATFTAQMLFGDTTGIIYTWHSTLLDSTWNTSDSVATIAYPAAGTDTVSVTVANVYGSTAARRTLTVLPTCNIHVFPFTEGFENNPQCWQIVNQTEGQGWVRRDNYYMQHHGRYCMIGSYPIHGQPTDDWLISPAIVVPSTPGDPRMAFLLHCLYPFDMQVRVSTMGDSSTALFTDSLAVRTDAATSFSLNTYSVSLLPYAGQTIHLAFRNTQTVHAGFSSSDSWFLVLDNVEFYVYDTTSYHLPVVTIATDTVGYTCDAVDVQASVISGDTAGLNYTWHSSLLDSTMSLNSALITLNYPVGGIDTLTVTATNAYGSGIATVVVAVRQCEIADGMNYVSAPAASDAEFYCWKVWQFDSLQANISDTHGRWGRGGDSRPAMVSAEWNSNDASTPFYLDDWLISPHITLPAIEPLPGEIQTLTLRWNSFCDYSTFSVRVSTTGRNTPAAFTDTLYTETQGNNIFNQWETHTVDLTPYAGQTVCIAFHHTGPITWRGWGFVSMDSLMIDYNVVPLLTYELTLAVNDTTMGSVTGEGTYEEGSNVLITAVANEGYHFVMWNDSVTMPQRSVKVDTDTNFTAYFAPDTVWHTVTIHAQWMEGWEGAAEDLGAYVTGAGTYLNGDTVTLSAAHFKCPSGLYGWVFVPGDTIMENPYSFLITSDTVVTAVFMVGVGVAEVVGTSFALYPNPASTEVTLDCGGDAEAVFIDLHGREMMRVRCREGKNRVDIGAMPAGVYYLRLSSPSATVVRRLVKR